MRLDNHFLDPIVQSGTIILINALKVRFCIFGQDHTYICFKNNNFVKFGKIIVINIKIGSCTIEQNNTNVYFKGKVKQDHT